MMEASGLFDLQPPMKSGALQVGQVGRNNFLAISDRQVRQKHLEQHGVSIGSVRRSRQIGQARAFSTVSMAFGSLPVSVMLGAQQGYGSSGPECSSGTAKEQSGNRNPSEMAQSQGFVLRLSGTRDAQEYPRLQNRRERCLVRQSKLGGQNRWANSSFSKTPKFVELRIHLVQCMTVEWHCCMTTHPSKPNRLRENNPFRSPNPNAH